MGRKTQYSCYFTIDQNSMNNIIQEWLQVNSFELKDINGYQYYCSQGAFGCRSFEYYIQNNFLLIYAYIYTPDKAIPIDTLSGIYYHDEVYKKMIDKLLLRIENIPGVAINTIAQRYQTQNGQYNYQQTYARIQNYNQEYTGHRDKGAAEKMAFRASIFSLGFSVLNLLISLFGFSFGILPLIAIASAAIVGLNGKNKWISILALVCLGISICIILLQF